MQLLELMERVRSTDTNLIIAYVKDAFQNIQELSWENVTYSYIDIINGVEDYNFPANMVSLISLNINDNANDTYNNYEWRWKNLGRTFKLYKLSTKYEWDTPDLDVSNGIELEYTTRGYVFVKNPDGDSSYYNHTTAETAAVNVGEIVYITDGVRADYATRYHYYKRLSSALSSTDLSEVDYTDTNLWEDVTEISNPDENAYINCGNDLINTVEQYIRAKIADAENDIQGYEYRTARSRVDLERTIKNRMPEVRVRPPRRPFKLT